jgi:hypothetical protein
MKNTTPSEHFWNLMKISQKWVSELLLVNANSATFNNSLWLDMSPHSDTLSWFRANQSLLFILNAACLAEKQQMPIL